MVSTGEIRFLVQTSEPSWNADCSASPVDPAGDTPLTIFGRDAQQWLPVSKLWEEGKMRNEKKMPWIRWRDERNKERKKLYLGPGGGAGIGCGAGIGFGLLGGAGIGSSPWNHLKPVFGIGFGCGIGIGYGFGHGIGVLWDRKPVKTSGGKVLVIEI